MEKGRLVRRWLEVVATAAIVTSINGLGLANEESVAEILAKATEIETVYFETTEIASSSMSLPGGDARVDRKVWAKKGYLRQDTLSESTNAKHRIVVFTPQGGMSWESYTNTTKRFDTPAPDFPPALSADTTLGVLDKNSKSGELFKTLGSEVIDGKPTTILQTTYQVDGGVMGINRDVTTTAWIWNDKGVLLKAKDVYGIGPVSITTITTYRNYSFEDIPEEIFDVP